MKWIIAAFMSTCLIGEMEVQAQPALVEQASSLEIKGQFKEAAALLSKGIEEAAPASVNCKELQFELDRLSRIRADFPYTKEQLYSELKTSVKDLTPEEFEKWIAEGRFDSREIDGTRYYVSASVSNLFFRYPELNPRRLPAKDTVPLQKARLESVTAIRDAALKEKKPYVLPKRFHNTLTVTAKADAAPANETVRAWLPIPRRYPFQTDIQVMASSSPIRNLADRDSPIRSAYLEQPSPRGKPLEFRVEYEYTAFGVRFEVNPEEAKPINPNDPVVRDYLSEAPHVIFTPEIQTLAKEIAGNETNPYLRAKKFYDWISTNIKYSYAIEYSTIRNIGDYCRSKGYGDCGQEALLFMTLCRQSGIPARWQTGWNTFAKDKTIHDWCEIYIAPWGWMPVDPYMGIFAMRYATSLTPDEQKQIRDFYFGGLDQFRMIANSDHNQSLFPAKQSMRSDNVDFQRGELEWGNHNIYFDKYSWRLEVKEIKPLAP